MRYVGPTIVRGFEDALYKLGITTSEFPIDELVVIMIMRKRREQLNITP